MKLVDLVSGSSDREHGKSKLAHFDVVLVSAKRKGRKEEGRP